MPRYHACVWLSSLTSATLLIALNMQGPSSIHICWMNTSVTTIATIPDKNCSVAMSWSAALHEWVPETLAMWYLFYAWVIAILTFSVLAVIFATARLWEGLQVCRAAKVPTFPSAPAILSQHPTSPHASSYPGAQTHGCVQSTYEVRLQTIKDLILYVGTGVIYWLMAAIIYILLMLFCYPDLEWGTGQTSAAVLWSSMGLVIASKGATNALLWHLTARRFVQQVRGFGKGGDSMAALWRALLRARHIPSPPFRPC